MNSNFIIENNFMVEKKFSVKRENLEQIQKFISNSMENSGLEMNLASKISVCADEIFSNIIFYSKANYLTVKCSFNDEKLELTFIDDGKAFNPLEDSSEPDITATLEDRKIGGLGIFLVKKLMNFVSYERKDNTNIFSMGLNRT